jgi:hypothetical protein
LRPEHRDPQNFAQIEKGRYLASAGDCIACHTIPQTGSPFAGGRSIETPFGNIVSANITPDMETGIGAWSDDQFDDAVRRGVRPNGARLYPAMPYPYLTKMSRDDVLAIKAFLKTVKPLRNAVVTDTLPFPFNIRFGMRIWDALFFKEGRFQPNPQKPTEWNRGAFLVEGPGRSSRRMRYESAFQFVAWNGRGSATRRLKPLCSKRLARLEIVLFRASGRDFASALQPFAGSSSRRSPPEREAKGG